MPRDTLTIIDEGDYLIFDLKKKFTGDGPLILLSATGKSDILDAQLTYLLHTLQLNVVDSGLESQIYEHSIEAVDLLDFIESASSMAKLIFVRDTELVNIIKITSEQ